MNGEDLLLKVKETPSSLSLYWEELVGEVLTVRTIGQICDEAMHISPENVSLHYSSRSTVLQNFFH